ncbi:MAG: asparagine synthase (glutamine-hydrolyzing) [Candidatus Micrarchaeia archaeon]
MCGINGIFAKKKMQLPKIINGMNALLQRRGPDGSGTHVKGDTALGHTRLSIIDLSDAGRQPMQNEDGTVWVVFNGEIYNFKELRERLEEGGHRFSSNTDTEVLVHLYEEYGVHMLEELRGMFAFILLDEKKQEILVARDRFGQKPVFYAQNENGIFISSEIKPILENAPGLDTGIDFEALGYYFLRNFRHVPDPFTIYKGIRRLPPSGFMIIKNGEIKELNRYWKPSFKKNEKYSVGEFYGLLEEAIKIREVADVEISLLLSGGLDSSAITSVLVKDKPGVRTYSYGLDETDPELGRAKKISQLFGTTHQQFLFSPNQLEIIDEIIDYYGEPIYLPPLAYSFVLFRKIHDESIKVTLTGHGADELLFGYNGSGKALLVSRIFHALEPVPRGMFSFLSKVLPGGLGEFVGMASVPNWKKKGELYRKDSAVLERLFSENAYSEIRGKDFGSIIDEECKRCDSDWYIEHANWAGIMLENSHSVTTAADLPAMMNSLEVRAPFLDHKLAEYIFSLPLEEKVGSMSDPSKNKYILKKAMAGILPEETIYGKKMGFGYSVKIGDLIREEWNGAFRKRVLGGKALADGIFRRNFIERLFMEHESGKKRPFQDANWALLF